MNPLQKHVDAVPPPQSPMDVRMGMPPAENATPLACIELKNRKSVLETERAEELDAIVHGRPLVLDWSKTFHELLEGEASNLLQKRYPTFFAALCITTDWRYRFVTVLTFFWFLAAYFIEFFPCMQGLDVDKTFTMLNSIIVVILTTTNTLANPLLFTGKIHGRIRLEQVDQHDRSTNGVQRLLEAQLSCIKHLGQEKTLPSEGFALRCLLNYVPKVLIAQCVVITILTSVYWSKIVPQIFSDWECRPSVAFLWSTAYLVIPMTLACISFFSCLVTMCGLYISCSVCRSMVTAWITRYEATKYVHEGNLLDRVSRFDIRNDAYERYLLIHQFLTRSSQVWNTYLTIFLAATFLVFLYSSLIVFISAYSIVGLLQMEWQISAFMCFVTPLVLISKANAATQLVQKMFLYSVPPHANADLPMLESGLSFAKTQNDLSGGNFALIGGRREWLEFLASAPLQWTILGVPITFERLTGFVLGTLFALVTATIPRIISTASSFSSQK